MFGSPGLIHSLRSLAWFHKRRQAMPAPNTYRGSVVMVTMVVMLDDRHWKQYRALIRS
jgi:hypothetical protein